MIDMQMKKPKYIIFDCDGVLVDSEIINNRIEAELKTSFGFPTTLEEQIHKFVGLGQSNPIIKEELKRLPANYIDLVDQKIREAYPKELRAVNGVSEFLEKMNLPKCIASSSEPEWIKLKLSITGLDRHFTHGVFSGKEVKHGKPAPDLFLHAMKQMGWTEPSEVLVVEDSIAGVTAGRAAGLTVCGFVGASHILPGHSERLFKAGAHAIIYEIENVRRFLS